MVAVTLKSNIDAVTRGLSDISRRQVPYAAYRAVNDTAFHVMRMERRATRTYLDNPTPFTQRSPRVQRAPSKRLPVAWVYITPDANEYVERLVEGGFERPEKRALLSPVTGSRAVLNKYGNIHRTFTKRTKAKKARYFFGVPKGRQGERYGGIWERYGRGGRKVRQLVHFNPGGRVVEKRWPFYRIAQVHAYTRFPRFFSRHFERALRTARR